MRPSILGFFTMGMTTLSMLSVSCVLYSAGSGVKRVLVVLSGLRWSWFCCVQAIDLLPHSISIRKSALSPHHLSYV